MNEQNPNTDKKPRAPKSDGPKNYLLSIGGVDYLVRLDAIRVADQKDLNRALDGDIPRGEVVKKGAAS